VRFRRRGRFSIRDAEIDAMDDEHDAMESA
jgi:hypothetical protein